MRRLLVVAVHLVMIAAGCASSPDDVGSEPVRMVDSGSWYTAERWPHDGQPVEGTSFVVYSDAAGIDARRELAALAEETWAALLEEFSIEPRMLRYPEGQERLHVYANHDHDPEDWEARAYYGGVIVRSPDHERHASARLGRVLEHELVHVLQSLLTGHVSEPPHTWFLEGLAEVVAGGTAGGAIRGLAQLDDLTDEYGDINPISIERYSQISSPEEGERFHYPMFQLAVEYLVDDDGYGRSLANARDVFVDIGAGASFRTAFESRMGIDLDDYEAEYFDRMEVYLPHYRNPVFSPAGLTAVSALTVLLVAGAPLLAYRRWRFGPEAGHVGLTSHGRPAVIGFLSGMIASGAIVVAYFLTALVAFGTTYELNNEMYSSTRMRAYWTLAAYLLVSGGVLLWAMWKWTHGARSAFLATPLIVLATLAATLVLTATAT